MKRVAVFGSTGSIGTNTLAVLAEHDSEFSVQYLTTFGNVDLLYEQARQFRPAAVATFKEVNGATAQRFLDIDVQVFSGFDGILELSRRDDFDVMVNALVGAIGLEPTLNAIKNGRRIALANKETLVIGGKLVMQAASESGSEIIPIDSEHSALLQCLLGEEHATVHKVMLTASGGPFRDLNVAKLAKVSVSQALNHPNWSMGPKITIDSATMMNKGLEVIEAHWLFGLGADDIQVVIHPQSIIHSMVEYKDGSVKAQLGLPDMRIPIQYALTFPRRFEADFPRIDFMQLRALTFEEPDLVKFRCLKLAYDSMRDSPAAPAVLNAANEEAVNLFLNEQIRFSQIPEIVEEALCDCDYGDYDSLEQLLAVDRMSRDFVKQKYA